MNKEKFYWLNDNSRLFLKRGYLKPGQEAEERIREIANHAEKLNGIEGFAEKFEEYMSRGWFSLSSPVWSNYGTNRGMPVSCFNSHVPDTMEGILGTVSEVGMLSKYGGGTSGYFGELRPRGAKIKDNGFSSGSVHFIQLFDSLSNIVSQGSVRRGYFAAYLDIDHPDFDEFIKIGHEDSEIQNIKTGVCVSDEFLNKMVEGDEEAQRRWVEVLKSRSAVGFPYIFFKDTVNNQKPKTLEGKEIKSSNLCSEICLPSDDDHSFVCVLSSLNLLHYDEWKDTDAVEVLMEFLDTVCTEFINRASELDPTAYRMIKRAVQFTAKYRALGLGVLGWHSYLQSNMIPFESLEASKLNNEIFKNISQRAAKVAEKNENATSMAIAPTKSSSFILGGVSQGIEPELSNYYIKDLSKLKVTMRNPYLEKLLYSKGVNSEEVWDSIIAHDGSVQHLDFLSEKEKGVFKTFIEISPVSIVDQASVRQSYIDQSQSLNLIIEPGTPVKDINALYLRAWRQGVKTLYYQYNLNAAQSMQRKRTLDKNTGCSVCEG